MTATEIVARLSFIRASMAYLNKDNHKAGLRAAIKDAGVYDLPQGHGTRETALAAALATCPTWNYATLGRQLRAAVIAAAEAWTVR
ncbi:hypothetical protein [Nocardia tengchongensis]|uniref:hypothetical protein n=1 Tax=Nocardia tengchongensis TaxID=2055889 RepID=UPI0036A8452C